MRRRCFLNTLTLAGMALGLDGVSLGGTVKKPNMVWFFADDHSYQTFGAYGGRLEHLDPTPNLDTLARDGMLFEKCYVENSICAPSRATLLTGKMSHKHGKYFNVGPFDHHQQTFPQILQEHGYQNALIGKIHLHGTPQGFDYFEVLPGQGRYKNPIFMTAEGRTRYEGHSTDVIVDRALNWLENMREPDQPFMLMVHFKAPHRPWEPASRFMDMYADVHIPEPHNLFDDFATRGIAARDNDMCIENSMTMRRDLKVDTESRSMTTGKYARRNIYYHENKENLTGKALTRWKYQLYMKDFLRCIKGIDENVGRILKYLEENKLAQDTAVMYSSDQGFYMGEHGWFDKRFMYEESFRTPLVVRWPGVVKPGSRNKDLVQNIDFAPTFLEMAGVPIPSDIQGESLVPILKGQTPDNWRRSLYYHYYEFPLWHYVRKHEGAADKRYKLIRFYGEEVPDGEYFEFYDLDKDPSEMNNVYGNPDYAERIDSMKKELARLREYYQVPEDDSHIPRLHWNRETNRGGIIED